MGANATKEEAVRAIAERGLRGVVSWDAYESGALRSCRLEGRNELETSCATLVPRFGPETMRSKSVPSVSFYEDGSVRAVSLEEQQEVATPIGSIPAEFVTFFPSGALKALFPVNGKITGFWTQKDEGELCPRLDFRLSCGAFSAKVSCIRFYEGGLLRSMTLWPGEHVLLRTNQGPLPARNGFSLYEDGSLESVEPPYPIAVETPVGVVEAFDSQALGVTGDVNSLSFWADGSMRGVTTMKNRVDVITGGAKTGLPAKTVSFAPAQVTNPLLENKTMLSPLRISFVLEGDERVVTFSNGVESGAYPLEGTCFRVFTGGGESTESVRDTTQMSCGDCSACNLECSSRPTSAH